MRIMALFIIFKSFHDVIFLLNRIFEFWCKNTSTKIIYLSQVDQTEESADKFDNQSDCHAKSLVLTILVWGSFIFAVVGWSVQNLVAPECA